MILGSSTSKRDRSLLTIHGTPLTPWKFLSTNSWGLYFYRPSLGNTVWSISYLKLQHGFIFIATTAFLYHSDQTSTWICLTTMAPYFDQVSNWALGAVQRRAIKSFCYSSPTSYLTTLKLAGILPLQARRVDLSRRFFRNICQPDNQGRIHG